MFRWRHRTKPQGLLKQLPIKLQELAGISGTGIGDDKADVEITRGICKHREEVRLGKVERDDTVLDTGPPGCIQRQPSVTRALAGRPKLHEFLKLRSVAQILRRCRTRHL